MNNQQNFYTRCYTLLKQVPEGKVTTYAEIAKAMNSTACRAVGTAMAKNTDLINTPCHRVVRSDGSIGQYALGPDKKASLLSNEDVEVVNGKVINIEKFIYYFNRHAG